MIFPRNLYVVLLLAWQTVDADGGRTYVATPGESGKVELSWNYDNQKHIFNAQHQSDGSINFPDMETRCRSYGGVEWSISTVFRNKLIHTQLAFEASIDAETAAQHRIRVFVPSKSSVIAIAPVEAVSFGVLDTDVAVINLLNQMSWTVDDPVSVSSSTRTQDGLTHREWRIIYARNKRHVYPTIALIAPDESSTSLLTQLNQPGGVAPEPCQSQPGHLVCKHVVEGLQRGHEAECQVRIGAEWQSFNIVMVPGSPLANPWQTPLQPIIRSVFTNSVTFQFIVKLATQDLRGQIVPSQASDFEALVELTNSITREQYITSATILTAKIFRNSAGEPYEASLDLRVDELSSGNTYAMRGKARLLNDSEPVLLYARPWSSPVVFTTFSPFVGSDTPVVTAAISQLFPSTAIDVTWEDVKIGAESTLIGYYLQYRVIAGKVGEDDAISLMFGVWQNVSAQITRDTLLSTNTIGGVDRLFCNGQPVPPSAYTLGMLYDVPTLSLNATRYAANPSGNCTYVSHIANLSPSSTYEFRAQAAIKRVVVEDNGSTRTSIIFGQWSNSSNTVRTAPRGSSLITSTRKQLSLREKPKVPNVYLSMLMIPVSLDPHANTTELSTCAVSVCSQDKCPGVLELVNSHAYTHPEIPQLSPGRPHAGTIAQGGSDLHVDGGNGAIFIELLDEQQRSVRRLGFGFVEDQQAAPIQEHLPGWEMKLWQLYENPGIVSFPLNDTGVTGVKVHAWGAGGGCARSLKPSYTSPANDAKCQLGGHGAYVSSSFPVQRGDSLLLLVGRGGLHASGSRGGRGGIPGGANGGMGTEHGGGGGGGFTAVYLVDEITTSGWDEDAPLWRAGIDFKDLKFSLVPLLVAAGGGGAGGGNRSIASGGAGGPLQGDAGLNARLTDEDPYLQDTQEAEFGLKAYNDLQFGLPGQGGSSCSARGGKGGISPPEYRTAKPFLSTVEDGLLVHDAGTGYWWEGGQGGAGYSGGGGGGGGIFGGGGGAAALRAAGGGGGASYIHAPSVAGRAAVATPLVITTELLGCCDVKLQWNAYSFWTTAIDRYDLSAGAGRWMPAGAYTIEWEVAGDGNVVVEPQSVVIRAISTDATFAYTIPNLRPDTMFIISVTAQTPTILSPLSASKVSTSITTRPAPELRWSMLGSAATTPTHFLQHRRRVTEQDHRRSPPALRGASFTHFEGFVYLFGGLTTGYDCLVDGVNGKCAQNAGTTADLWKYEPATSQWELLTMKTNVLPPSRERHAAAAWNGSIYVFGGVSGKTKLSDMWAIRVSNSMYGTIARSDLADITFGYDLTDHTYSPSCNPYNSESDWLKSSNYLCGIPEERYAWIPILPSVPLDACVQDIEIQVDFVHAAPEEVEILLRGDAVQFYDVADLPYIFQSGDIVATPAFPAGSFNPSALWRNISTAIGGDTVPLVAGTTAALGPTARWSTWKLTFNDSASTTSSHCVNEAIGGSQSLHESAFDALPSMSCNVSEWQLPKDNVDSTKVARCRPAAPLSTFAGSRSVGPWAVQIMDNSPNTRRGYLKQLKYTFNTRSCVQAYEWKAITPAQGNTPNGAILASAVYGDAWYVSVDAGNVLSPDSQQMWQFDFNSKQWMLVTPPSAKQLWLAAVRRFVNSGLAFADSEHGMFIQSGLTTLLAMPFSAPEAVQVFPKGHCPDCVAPPSLLYASLAYVPAEFACRNRSCGGQLLLFGGEDHFTGEYSKYLWRLDIPSVDNLLE